MRAQARLEVDPSLTAFIAKTTEKIVSITPLTFTRSTGVQSDLLVCATSPRNTDMDLELNCCLPDDPFPSSTSEVNLSLLGPHS